MTEATDSDYEGPFKENKRFKVWIGKPYRQGNQTRGNLGLSINSDKLSEDIEDNISKIEEDMKVSSQNIKQLVKDTDELYDLGDELKKNIRRAFNDLEGEARAWALGESSDAEHQEDTEELDVSEDEIEDTLQPSYLVSLIKRTDSIHKGDYILKAVAGISAASKSLIEFPLNLWSIGSSGAGKTHCFKTVFRTIPKERKIKFNSCSPKAVYYFTEKHGEEAFQNKVVMFNEAEASSGAVEVLRSFTDPDAEEVTLSTVMDQKYLEITIDGTPVTWFTSVDPLEDKELQNRFLFSNPEEGSNHKKKIAEHQMKNFQEGVLQPIKEEEFPELKAAFRQITEEASDFEVKIPYEWKWNRKGNPRLQKYFAALVMTVAKIHYEDRITINTTLVASLEDYYLAKFIWSNIEEVTLDRINEQHMEVLQHIDEDIAKTRNDLQEDAGMGYNKVRHATEKLQDAGLIRGEKDGNQWEYTKLESEAAKPASLLVKESCTLDSILKSLEGTLTSASNTTEREGVRSLVEKKVLHLTPRVWRELHAVIKDNGEDVISVFEDEKHLNDKVAEVAAVEDGSEPDIIEEESKVERPSDPDLASLYDQLNQEGGKIELDQVPHLVPGAEKVELLDGIRESEVFETFKEGNKKKVRICG